MGVFIARISRGRTVRAFLAGVILAPALGSYLWFAMIGESGLRAIATDPAGPVATAALAEPIAALFWLLASVPPGPALSWAALLLLAIFLITSTDSAAYVLGMMSTGGRAVPPVAIRLLLGALLLLAAGLMAVASVEVVRGMAILGALPYPLILAGHTVVLLLALRSAGRDGKG